MPTPMINLIFALIGGTNNQMTEKIYTYLLLKKYSIYLPFVKKIVEEVLKIILSLIK